MVTKSLEEIAREAAWQVPQFRDTIRNRIKDLHAKALKAKNDGDLQEYEAIEEQARILEVSWKIYSPEEL